MVTIPASERIRFETVLSGQAQRFGLSSEEYLRKIWYHEEASRFGEYVATVLLSQLLDLVPKATPGDEVETEDSPH